MSAPNNRLDGWKEIAAYLGKTSWRTAMRWHEERGLPVHRESPSKSARVYAFRHEIDTWRNTQVVPPLVAVNGKKASPPPATRTRWIGLSILLALLLTTIALFRFWRTTPVVNVREIHSSRLFWRATAEGGIPTRFALPAEFEAMTMSPRGDVAYLYNYQKPTILSFPLAGGEATSIDSGTPISSLAISPDGKTLYIGSYSDGVHIFDLSARIVKTKFDIGNVSRVALTSSGDTLFLACGWKGVRQLNTKSGEVNVLTHEGNALHLVLSPDQSHLVVTYQNGGPGGREGHDAFQVFHLANGSVKTAHGPPLVAGQPTVAANGDVWIDMWDACDSSTLDQAGCPYSGARGFQVFRPPDYRHRQSIVERGQPQGPAMALGDYIVVSRNFRLDVIDATRLRLLERWTPGKPLVTSMAQRSNGRVLLLREKELIELQPEPPECLSKSIKSFAAFDGSWQDASEENEFVISGEAKFIPGRVGQAAHLEQGAQASLKSSSIWRFGDPGATAVSLAFWVRPPAKDSPLISRDHPGNGWLLEQVSGSFKLHLGLEVQIDGPGLSDGWHHVVLTRAETQFALFIDGEPRGSALSTTLGARTTTPFLLYGPADFDEFAMFDRTLTAAEVRSLYQSRVSGPCSP